MALVSREVLGRIKTRRVLIQAPEGLKTNAFEIAAELEAAGFDPVISGDPCFGACDLRTLEGATTLHFAHSKMVESEMPVIYSEYRHEADCRAVTKKALPLLAGKTVGIITTVQHIHELDKVRAVLEAAGKRVIIGKRGGRVAYDGQVLGCDFTTAKVKADTLLYIGSGLFHPVGAAYYTGLPVVRADPLSGEAEAVDATSWIEGRALRLLKAGEPKIFGILVSSKPGQHDLKRAEALKARIEAAGKTAFIILLDLITPDTLMPYKADAFVVTACPRIVIDDWKNYKKTLLLPDELTELLR